MNLVVGVSDMKCSRDPSAVLVTYSLGSCIAVAVYDRAVRAAGLLHFQLPSGAGEQVRNPLMYADTGMNQLLLAMTALGAEPKRLTVKLAGGAQMLNDASLFNIGRRNHAAIRKVLWQRGMFIDGETIGGSIPRTLYLSAATGETIIKTQGQTLTL